MTNHHSKGIERIVTFSWERLKSGIAAVTLFNGVFVFIFLHKESLLELLEKEPPSETDKVLVFCGSVSRCSRVHDALTKKNRINVYVCMFVFACVCVCECVCVCVRQCARLLRVGVALQPHDALTKNNRINIYVCMFVFACVCVCECVCVCPTMCLSSARGCRAAAACMTRSRRIIVSTSICVLLFVFACVCIWLWVCVCPTRCSSSAGRQPRAWRAHKEESYIIFVCVCLCVFVNVLVCVFCVSTLRFLLLCFGLLFSLSYIFCSWFVFYFYFYFYFLLLLFDTLCKSHFCSVSWRSVATGAFDLYFYLPLFYFLSLLS